MLPTPVFLGFPCGSAGKESACNAGDLGLIPGLGSSSGEGNGNPLQNPGEFHGQRSLAGYSSWGRKESETTERLNNSNGKSKGRMSGRALVCVERDQHRSGWEHPLEKGMATHSSILAWRIPWTV